jgi:hypothetical protein
VKRPFVQNRRFPVTLLATIGRHQRPFTALAAAAAAAALTVGLTLPGAASARGARPVPPPPTHPTSADQIQNIDQVRTAIKGYYGDTETTAVDPVPNDVDGGDKTLHTYAPDGAYVAEMAGIERTAMRSLDRVAKVDDKPGRDAENNDGQRAILLDVDDTTLNTFSYEIYSNFAFNPSTNASFVNAAVFPEVPGMPELVNHAADRGYAIFFLTGRPVTQHDGTLANLTSEGYPVTDSQLYLKDLCASWLTSCAPTCSTVQYKSLTRQHIESLGYDIVANFGDQFSDLEGGFADQTYKLPNPMYFLP